MLFPAFLILPGSGIRGLEPIFWGESWGVDHLHTHTRSLLVVFGSFRDYSLYVLALRALGQLQNANSRGASGDEF